MDFKVHVGSVHGPLETILELVEKRKLYVNEISLATITDEFLTLVETKKLTIEERIQFVSVASALLLIKARSLLPSLALTQQEEDQITDLQTNIERYALIRARSRLLGKMWGSALLHLPLKDPKSETVFSPASDMQLERIVASIQYVLQTLPKPPASLKEARVLSSVSLEQMIVSLTERIGKTDRTSFSRITKSKKKEEVVLFFLALLELVKRGAVQADQDSDGTIVIARDSIHTPRY